ncbi:hypothetical protein H6G89_30835 [Oscillatoria sp. FACHB-1407]|uniref:energy transducer TonB n=1 Tax=Oscillatoria sp. FACHB-1407 TaxID=2692847 RepID=UPI001683E93F|nr:hypothetical protein [Oscillatoria sp. FACHB-1407]MBD2465406.1 hypothetical protein [Oscillatoria sp. FACHB-1407]
MASVGVHGLMWVVLPLLPVQSSPTEEPDIRRSVALLELTPAEQGRLPDFSTPQVTVPPVPQEEAGSDFFSLAPLPNPYPSVPTQPPVPNYQTLPPIVLPQLPPPPQYTNRRSTNSNPLRRRTETTIPPEAPPETNTPAATPSPTPSETVSPSPGADALNPNRGESSNPPGATPNPQGTAPAAPPDRLAQLRQEQLRLRQLYTYSSEGTSRGFGEEQSLRWFTEALGRSPDDVDQIPLHEIEVAPPREACFARLQRLPDQAWFGVVLDADGNFVVQPSKLRSSGYEAFDQQALAAIAEYDFEQAATNEKPDYAIEGDRRVYYVRVKFGQNLTNCPSQGATPSGAPQSNEG